MLLSTKPLLISFTFGRSFSSSWTTLCWNQRGAGELFQTRDCKACNFFLFSVKDCAKTPSVGSTWLRDLPKVHSWPQGSFRSQNISCPSKFRTANPALWLSKSCEVEVTCTSRWNIHFYHHFNHSSKTAIMETFPVLLGLEEEALLISRKPELNTIWMERISEGFTKRRPILLGFCPVNIIYSFIYFPFGNSSIEKKKRKEKKAILVTVLRKTTAKL